MNILWSIKTVDGANITWNPATLRFAVVALLIGGVALAGARRYLRGIHGILKIVVVALVLVLALLALALFSCVGSYVVSMLTGIGGICGYGPVQS
jgi:hypothetical protein